ncbi:Pheromone-processing carboxypeptidase kex1 [Golovinomyces cichoracearum]|uniref:Carboxypeptidase n=1 Tax=Golovinomyces cichoracearum TaxID=62708 RepID=A0A420J8J1_9PEZI|nr:Pheromone-processing carboxypeptidase kex1 [Golovinomyces cichoracearum]
MQFSRFSIRSNMARATILFSLCAIFIGSSSTEKTAADYFVRSLPGAPPGPLLSMHAGHVEVDSEHHGNIFFWLYQNRHIANKQRLVIWLNGGPGCSSEDGALMEVGPYRVKNTPEGQSLEYNDGSWDEFSNLMFVDNPIGTGFSYVDTDSYVHDLPIMADQFVKFLENWFKLFPQFEQDDIYLAGESYAGQHIPYIAKAILERNKKAERNWKLKGMLIGNGWISPVEQYKSYLSYAYERGLVKRGSEIANKIESQQAICIKELNEEGGKDRIDLKVCEDILQQILRLSQDNVTDENSQCINMYDVRKKDSYPSCGMNWPPDLSAVTTYLRRNDVIEALHVDPQKRTGWKECNGDVRKAFKATKSKPAVQILPQLIAEVPIVLYSGSEDMICNHIGTEELISNMEWNGGKGFEVSAGIWAPRRDWEFEGESAGFWQEARNLTYVLFYNSSHMVPFDYSRRTRDMLDRFMKVDISSIGGTPTNSRIDGEKGIETSVGGHPNSTAAQEAELAKLEAAKWSAYYKSGEIVLVIVTIAAAGWGYFIWRERKKRAGYSGLFGDDTPMALGGARRVIRADDMHLKSSRMESKIRRDVELEDFDESALEDFHKKTSKDMEQGRYSIGGSSDDDDEIQSFTMNRKGKQSAANRR